MYVNITQYYVFKSVHITPACLISATRMDQTLHFHHYCVALLGQWSSSKKADAILKRFLLYASVILCKLPRNIILPSSFLICRFFMS